MKRRKEEKKKKKEKERKLRRLSSSSFSVASSNSSSQVAQASCIGTSQFQCVRVGLLSTSWNILSRLPVWVSFSHQVRFVSSVFQTRNLALFVFLIRPSVCPLQLAPPPSPPHKAGPLCRMLCFSLPLPSLSPSPHPPCPVALSPCRLSPTHPPRFASTFIIILAFLVKVG